MIKLAIHSALLVANIVLSGCGKPPAAQEPVAANIPVFKQAYVCNVTFSIEGDVVSNMISKAVIPNGSYTTNDYYGKPCNYTVLDGTVSQVAAAPAAPVTALVCGIKFTEQDGQVYQNGVIVPTGSYSIGGMTEPFYVPACNYTVLDGAVCAANTKCGGTGW